MLLKNGNTLTDHAAAQQIAASAACTFANNSDCYGDGLGPPVSLGPHGSPADCCALCQKAEHCKVAVFVPANDAKPPHPSDGHRCLLKGACTDPRPCQNRVRCNLPGVDPGSLAFGTLPLTQTKWKQIKKLAIVGPNADNVPMLAGLHHPAPSPMLQPRQPASQLAFMPFSASALLLLSCAACRCFRRVIRQGWHQDHQLPRGCTLIRTQRHTDRLRRPERHRAHRRWARGTQRWRGPVQRPQPSGDPWGH